MALRTSDLMEQFRLHVLQVPAGMDENVESNVSMALAVPEGFFAQEALAAGLSAEPMDAIGQSMMISLPAGEKLDLEGTDHPVPLDDATVPVVLVDVSDSMQEFILPFDPEVHDVDLLHPFDGANVFMMPLAEELTNAAWDWIADPSSGQRVSFYSADEGVEEVPVTPVAPLPERSPTRGKPKVAPGTSRREPKAKSCRCSEKEAYSGSPCCQPGAVRRCPSFADGATFCPASSHSCNGESTGDFSAATKQTICLEAALGDIRFDWLITSLTEPCRSFERDANAIEKFCCASVRSWSASCQLCPSSRDSGAIGGKAGDDGGFRPSQGRASPEPSIDFTGSAPDSFRPPPGLSCILKLESLIQGLPRTNATSAGVSSAEGTVFPSCSSEYGEEDASNESGRAVTSRTCSSGCDPVHLPREIWRLRKGARDWQYPMAGWADSGTSSTRQCSSRKGCCSSSGRLPRAECFGWRSTGDSPVAQPHRRAAGRAVHKPQPLRELSWPTLRTNGRTEMDNDNFGIYPRDGFDSEPKDGCNFKAARQGQRPDRPAKSKESSGKEAAERKGKTEGKSKGRGGDLTGFAKPLKFHLSSSSSEKAPEPALQPASMTSFRKVAASMPRWILEAKTKFSSLLACSFSLQCRGSAPASIVFPLPLADFNLFAGDRGPKLSLRRWSTLVRKRLLHLVIVALNYVEGCLSHDSLHLLGRRPNDLQKKVHQRLWSLLTMCDSPSIGDIPIVPGRSGPEFIARLAQLESFAEKEGYLSVEKYASGPADFEKKHVGQVDFDESMLPARPYTSLDAGRLKLVGQGKWDLQGFLEDSLFWLPYVEPKILHHGIKIDRSLGPNLKKEDPAECEKLALLWNSKGLLGLSREPPFDEAFTRVFNCYKNPEHDRQIGDRRLANMTECGLQGPSKFLPGGYMLTNLHVPRGHLVYGSISDRKDFYHQCAVSRERMVTNLLPFPLDESLFQGSQAFDDLCNAEGKSLAREVAGDRLGFSPKPLLGSTSRLVYPGFRSLLQGDHLGVEFAMQGHETMLKDAGLLGDDCRVRGHHPLPIHGHWQGLVIDDFFSLEVCPTSTKPHQSASVQDIEMATACYDRWEVIGSPEKDILGSRHFKVVGAEIDASAKALSLKKVLVAAPLQKRIALSLLSMRAARMPIISAALASRLTGNWTSVFMFRRCLACVFSELFAFGVEKRQSEGEVYELPRSTAEELVLASILGFVAVTDATAKYSTTLYATDASMQKGAVVSRKIPEDASKVLWLGGDKKGAYTSLDPPFRELMRALGEDEEDIEIRPAPASLSSTWRAPDFSFDFIEVCAGIGSVSQELSKLGYRVAPPIELSDSRFYDVRDLRLINWLCNMIKSKRIRSLFAQPVCTTFSPAAHPAVRSYSQPKGFNRLCPKTLLGNVIAFRCLFLVWFAAEHGCPSLCEQPRLSKMAWLSIWQFLLRCKGFEEAIVASCQFGSIHRKEFRILGFGLQMSSLQKKCPGGHDHVRIEGKYTKKSAVYVPALAKHFALHIARALRAVSAAEEDSPDVRGLESVLCNDLLTTGDWQNELTWRWRKPSHINILESSSFVTLLRLAAKDGGDIRFNALLDSQVAKCSQAKGRSSALALRPTLRKSAALQVACGLYPALGFAPTRINTADAPTRDKEQAEVNLHNISDLASAKTLQKLHSVAVSRKASAWIRLTFLLLLVMPSTASQHELSLLGLHSELDSEGHSLVDPGFLVCCFPDSAFCLETLDFVPYMTWLWTWIWALSFTNHCYNFGASIHSQLLGFTSIMTWLWNWIWALSVFDHFAFFASLCIWIWSLLLSLRLCISLFAIHPRSVTRKLILVLLLNAHTFSYSPKSSSEYEVHGMQPLPLAGVFILAAAMPINPANRDETAKAERRASVTLFADRVVRPQTRSRRDQLLLQFNEWLLTKAQISLDDLLGSRDILPEQISEYLVAYGKELFYGGKSYGRFAETINGVASRKPVLRRQLTGAWDLAFSWVADEPARHHPAMPLTVVLAFSSLALLWGWPVESALLLLTWTGLLRIGETLSARRKDLILPQDGDPGLQFALLQIQQPKTRGVAAKHQAARVDPYDVIQLLSAVFGKWSPDDRLWKLSPGAFRKRFATLLRSLGLPVQRTHDTTPFDLASLRPGGATFLLHRFEDADLVRRRGRWISVRVLEIYLQEVQAVTYQARISPQARRRVADLASAFPTILEKALFFLQSSIPCTAWPLLW